MKICLTANSGGHLNELLQIRNFLSDDKDKIFFVIDKTLMTKALAEKEKVYFVKKFILREVIRRCRIVDPILNILQSLHIFYIEKPDVVITTGAGTSLGLWICGKLFKKNTIFVESAARVNNPSTFGKYIGSRSSHILVQWPDMLNFYPKSLFAGLIFNIKNPPILKSQKIIKIFITAGTYKIQFNRMFKAIDQIAGKNGTKYEITAQVGTSDYIPKHYSYYQFAKQSKIHEDMKNADLIICQAGAGSIFDAILLGKKVIAIPRLVEFDEFFDYHQKELAGNLSQENILLYLENTDLLQEKLLEAENFIPEFYKLSSTNFLFKDVLRNNLKAAK